MTESTDLDQIAKEIRAATEECGTMVLTAVLTKDDLPTVVLDADTFPTLIRHLKPPLL